MRSVRTPTDTLSTESRLTAVGRLTGSSPGSRSTSLASPRMVVVHGAMSARRSRGIAASRDRTTTGRRPISGSSHHHSSPRKGKEVMLLRPQIERNGGRPIRLAHRVGVRRRRGSRRRSSPRDFEPAEQRGPRRKERRRCVVGSRFEPPRGALRQQLYLRVIEPWHKHGIFMARTVPPNSLSMTSAMTTCPDGGHLSIPPELHRL